MPGVEEVLGCRACMTWKVSRDQVAKAFNVLGLGFHVLGLKSPW